ncbi:MAG: DUF167 domain-containing protein [Thermodesulfobacteriota bacterium]
MYLEVHKEGLALKIRVIPRASRNEVVGLRGDCLCVKICAAPTEGQANAELLRFLGKTIGLPPSSLQILRGKSSKEKVILIPGDDREWLQNKLLPAKP